VAARALKILATLGFLRAPGSGYIRSTTGGSPTYPLLGWLTLLLGPGWDSLD